MRAGSTIETETTEAPKARRGGRSKAAATPVNEEEDSSALDIPASAPTAPRARGRKAKVTPKDTEDGVDSAQDEDELDSLPQVTSTSTRRTGRSRTTPQPDSFESSQDAEDIPTVKKTARKAGTGARKVKVENAATKSDKENASMESDGPVVKAAPKTRKKAVAATDEPPAETSAQTKRTTRTKR